MLAPRPCALAAGLYAVLAGGLLIDTWCNTSPKYHGYDWVLVTLVTLPWSPFFNILFSIPAAVIGGVALNTGVVYLFGAFLASGKRRPHD